MSWHYRSHYILLDAPQTSELWFKYRQGRVTGSKTGALVGHSSFSTSVEEVEYLLGNKEKIFTEAQKYNMAIGTIREPYARVWYNKTYNVYSIEIGIVFPTWDTRLGASVDGVVISPHKMSKDPKEYSEIELLEMADGILEIKSPKSMYRPLMTYLQTPMILPNSKCIEEDIYIYENYFNHIQQTHFDQMQQGMAILDKPWCDYVVYAPQGIFRQRVPYCRNYFVLRLLHPIQKLLNENVDTRLKDDWRCPIPIPMPA